MSDSVPLAVLVFLAAAIGVLYPFVLHKWLAATTWATDD